MQRRALITVAAAALAADPRAVRAQAQSPYKIGLTYPLTGPLVPIAGTAQQGVELAIDDVNRTGGVGGHPLALDVADSQGTPEGGVAAMRKLVEVDGVQCILTLFTNVVTAEMPLGDQLRVPTLSPVESPDLVSRSQYSFAHSQTISEEGPLLTAFWKRHGYKRIYALLGDNAWGHTIEPIVRQAMEGTGAQTDVTLFDLNQTDFRGVIARVADFHPDALLVTAQGSTGETSMISQLRQLGVSAALFDTGNYYQIPTWRNGVGPYVAGMYFAGLNIDESINPAFVRAYRARTGHDPAYGDAEAYDQLKMLAYAIARGGYSGPAIRDQLLALRGIPSVFGGEIVMQPNHYTKTSALAIWHEQNGKLVKAT